MTDPLRAVILGIVEGITEFLPISSTGHMILVEGPLGIPKGDPFWSGAFDIFIQIGAILAVVVYFWRRLWSLIAARPGQVFPLERPLGRLLGRPLVRRPAEPAESSPPLNKSQTRRGEGGRGGVGSPNAAASGQTGTLPYATASTTAWHDHILVKLFVAFLPAAVVGLVASKFIERHLKTPPVVAGALIVGGILIILIERRIRIRRFQDAGTIPLGVAFMIGVAQCFSLIPGTSRSAATIMGALLMGLTHAAAAEFSFFLAIPTMLAAGGYSLLKHIKEIQPNQFALLGLGFSIAFVVALLVVAVFMRYIRSHKFTSFAIYRIILGALVLLALRSGFLSS